MKTVLFVLGWDKIMGNNKRFFLAPFQALLGQWLRFLEDATTANLHHSSANIDNLALFHPHTAPSTTFFLHKNNNKTKKNSYFPRNLLLQSMTDPTGSDSTMTGLSSCSGSITFHSASSSTTTPPSSNTHPKKRPHGSSGMSDDVQMTDSADSFETRLLSMEGPVSDLTIAMMSASSTLPKSSMPPPPPVVSVIKPPATTTSTSTTTATSTSTTTTTTDEDSDDETINTITTTGAVVGHQKRVPRDASSPFSSASGSLADNAYDNNATIDNDQLSITTDEGGDGDGDGDGDEKEVEHLRKQLSAAQDLISRLLEGKDGDSDGDSDSNNPPLPPNNTKSPKKHDRRKTNDKDNGNDNDNDTYYFDSYSSTTIHKTMLSDSVRTDAYRLAILSNPLLFKDAVVLDVGCGTGILSMFCCAAGARKVIGVDDSEMASKAREIVRRNGMEGRVEIVRGKMEDLDLAPYLPEDHPTVDVIVSEWMGYALLYESMLPSVISARERYLTPDRGIMWPNKCQMFIEAVRDPVDVDFWGDVYGFDMSPMTPLARRERTRKGEAAVEVVDKGTVCSDRCMFWGADLTEVKDRELDFEREFHLELNQDLEGGDEDKDDGKDDGKDKAEATNAMNAMNAMNAFVISFDIDFVGPQKSVSFSTGCQSPPTHWAQSLLWIEPSLVKSGLKKITGKLQLTRNDRNQRDIDITIEWRDGERDQNSKSAILGKQKWSLKS